MKRSQSQFSRMLELDRRIRRGKYPNCLTFAKQWEVSQKTIQRDIEYMTYVLGAPIAYDRVKKGYHYTDANWFLPAMNLSEGDLFALLVGSRALEQYRGSPVAGRLEKVFLKLAEALPDKISLRPELIFSRFSFTAPPAKALSEKVWTEIVRGLMMQKYVRIRYRPFESPAAWDRMVAPHHIANLQGEWYMFARQDGDDEIKQYSLARIESVRSSDIPFTVNADFDAEKLLAGTFGRFASGGTPYTVRLVFDKDVVEWVRERQWSRSQKIKPIAGGRVELTFQASGLYEVFRWVLAWGHNVRVLAPEELKQMVDQEVKLMAANLAGKPRRA